MEEDIKNELFAVKEKLNEVIQCLEDNELFKKVAVEPIYDEEEVEEETSDAQPA